MNKQWKRWLCMLAVVLAAALGVLPARAGVTSGSLRVTLTDRQGRPAKKDGEKTSPISFDRH